MNIKAESDLKLWFPAMDNGVVDAADVAEGSISAHIFYSAKENDIARLYLDNIELSSSIISGPNSVPHVFIISEDKITDGYHTAFYKVTDEAGNSVTSDEVYLYVDKENNAPLVTGPSIYGGDDQCITQDEYDVYAGLMVSVPYTITLSEHINSLLCIRLTRYDSNGNLVNNSSAIYTVTINNTIAQNGLTHIFNDQDVVYSSSGTAIVCYYIESGTDYIFSEKISVKIGSCDSSGNTITVTSDREEIYADGFDFAVLTAFVRDVNNKPVSGARLTWTASTGAITEYSDTDSNGKAVASVTSQTEGSILASAWLNDEDFGSVTIIASNDILHPLPAPEFPQANGGNYIPSATLMQDGQLYVDISYPEMSAGDTLILNTAGFLPDGSLDQAAISITQHELTSSEISNSKVTLNLPADYALSVQSAGMFLGNYIVSNTDIPGVRYSQTGFFTLDRIDQCLITTGSPIYDARYGIYPSNHGVVYGSPGSEFQLKCTGDAYFLNSNQSQSLAVNINENGEGRFDISSLLVGQTTVSGVNLTNAQQNFSITTRFDDYFVGTGKFHAARYTSNAPGDGRTPNSIYVISREGSGVTTLFIKVDDDAEFVGGEQSGTFPFNSSNAVSVDIIKPTPGPVKISMSLPESVGEEWDVSTTFV